MTDIEKTIKEIHDGVYQEGIRDGAEKLADLLRTTHMTINEALEKIKEEHHGNN